MNIGIGDVVQFTEYMLQKIAEHAPKLYDEMYENNRITGRVVAIEDDSVDIDVGLASGRPITVASDNLGESLRKAFRVIKSNNLQNNQQSMVEYYPPQSAGPPTLNAPHIPGDEPPATVKMSQWVMVQFLNLKQYVITQDLERTSDANAHGPTGLDPGEEWKAESKNLRAAVADLSPEEERLYNTAMLQIQNWINQKDGAAATDPEG